MKTQTEHDLLVIKHVTHNDLPNLFNKEVELVENVYELFFYYRTLFHHLILESYLTCSL